MKELSQNIKKFKSFKVKGPFAIKHKFKVKLSRGKQWEKA
jgi:hypothetical protein